MSTYPNGIFSWIQRVNLEDDVWANDPNSIADDLIAVEETLGTTPQDEKSPMVGPGPVEYGSVDARLSALQNGQHFGLCYLTATSMTVKPGQPVSTNYGMWNTYSASYDPYGMYNGIDITTPVHGWYFIHVTQYWDWSNSGYDRMALYIAGAERKQDVINWGFSGNITVGPWQTPNSQTTTPLRRQKQSGLNWQGPIEAGQRVSVLSENGTPNASQNTTNMELAVSMIARLS